MFFDEAKVGAMFPTKVREYNYEPKSLILYLEGNGDGSSMFNSKVRCGVVKKTVKYVADRKYN